MPYLAVGLYRHLAVVDEHTVLVLTLVCLEGVQQRIKLIPRKWRDGKNAGSDVCRSLDCTHMLYVLYSHVSVLFPVSQRETLTKGSASTEVKSKR